MDAKRHGRVWIVSRSVQTTLWCLQYFFFGKGDIVERLSRKQFRRITNSDELIVRIKRRVLAWQTLLDVLSFTLGIALVGKFIRYTGAKDKNWQTLTQAFFLLQIFGCLLCANFMYRRSFSSSNRKKMFSSTISLQNCICPIQRSVCSLFHVFKYSECECKCCTFAHLVIYCYTTFL